VRSKQYVSQLSVVWFLADYLRTRVPGSCCSSAFCYSDCGYCDEHFTVLHGAVKFDHSVDDRAKQPTLFVAPLDEAEVGEFVESVRVTDGLGGSRFSQLRKVLADVRWSYYPQMNCTQTGEAKQRLCRAYSLAVRCLHLATFGCHPEHVFRLIRAYVELMSIVVASECLRPLVRQLVDFRWAVKKFREQNPEGTDSDRRTYNLWKRAVDARLTSVNTQVTLLHSRQANYLAFLSFGLLDSAS